MRNERFLILLISLFAFIILAPILSPLKYGSRALDIAWVVVFFSCINAISRTRKHFTIAVLLFLASLAAKFAFYFIDNSYYELIAQSTSLAFSAAFYAYAGFLITAYVMKSGEVTGDKIAAAISVYLVIGAIWGSLFGLVETLHPGSLKTGIAAGKQSVSSAIYFSYVTLTTVGYGDIAPLSPVVRSMAIVEAIMGQLYIAIMIARLVGLHTAHSIKKTE